MIVQNKFSIVVLCVSERRLRAAEIMLRCLADLTLLALILKQRVVIRHSAFDKTWLKSFMKTKSDYFSRLFIQHGIT